jgi:hypothetical protein
MGGIKTKDGHMLDLLQRGQGRHDNNIHLLLTVPREL